MSGRRLSATADRPRRHLRVIPGRGLAEQVAIAIAHEMAAQQLVLERAPRDVRRVTIELDVMAGLVGRVHVAIERADTLAATGTAG